MKTATPNPSTIRQNYIANNCGHFFERETMRFFGDTMRSFGSIIIGGELFLYRKPSAMVNVFGRKQRAGREFFNAWIIDQESGNLSSANDEQKNAVWFEI